MSSARELETVLRCYPQIYCACHRRHVRDEETQELLSAHQAGVLDHLDDAEATSVLDLARHMAGAASEAISAGDLNRFLRGGTP